MGLFGKSKSTEAEAVSRFVSELAASMKRQWPAIAGQLKMASTDNEFMKEERHADFEFLLAAYAVQLRALRNVLPADQAARVRGHFDACIGVALPGGYAESAIGEYDKAWDEAAAAGEMPFHGTASMLFKKLGCRDTVSAGSQTFMNPVLLTAFGAILVDFEIGWWKNAAARHNIVP